MRASKFIGIDIGNYRLKVCLVNHGIVQDVFTEVLPENIVQNGAVVAWAAMGEFLRECLKKHGVRCRNAFISVPMNSYYLRRLKLPLMTIPQLNMNLPYEFHDYIAEETGSFYFDYSVLSRSETGLDLQAAAMSKELIGRYRDMAKLAKLKLLGLIPETLSYQRLLRHYNEHHDVLMDKDYAILDMGDQALRIHFFSKGYYETTRTLDSGGKQLVERVMELTGSDQHITRIRIVANQDGIMERPEVEQFFAGDSVQIMRVLNFYSFNNPKNTIDTLYICGGGVHEERMVDSLAEQLSLPVKLLTELIPEVPEELRGSVLESPQAYGVTVPLDQTGELTQLITAEEE